ncbi:MAG: M48 family metalloprotease, partial [Sediminibacterium sp.]|nr:M48 family metalloprotease [Sediminibacterium sp.]
MFKKTEEENKNTHVVNSIDSIVTHICKSNKIDRETIIVHVLNKDEINAFALPNGHLIIYSGLIHNSDNQEELTGVISHEIAHIELNHVMKKLVKEIGLLGELYKKLCIRSWLMFKDSCEELGEFIEVIFDQ